MQRKFIYLHVIQTLLFIFNYKSYCDIKHVASFGGGNDTDPAITIINGKTYLFSGSGTLLNVFLIDDRLQLQLIHSIFLRGNVRDCKASENNVYCAINGVGIVKIGNFESQTPQIENVFTTKMNKTLLLHSQTIICLPRLEIQV